MLVLLLVLALEIEAGQRLLNPHRTNTFEQHQNHNRANNGGPKQNLLQHVERRSTGNAEYLFEGRPPINSIHTPRGTSPGRAA